MTAHGKAVSLVVGDRNRRVAQVSAGRVVEVPPVGPAHVARGIEIVRRAVELVGAAFRHRTDLRTGRTVEVGRLSGGGNLEFFNGVGRRRKHATRRVAHAAKGALGVAPSVVSHAAVHIVRVVAAIQLERVLVVHRARDRAFRRNARLEDRQARDVGTEDRKIEQGVSGNSRTDGGVHGL